MTVAPIETEDLAWVLPLNRAHETELSPLTEAGLGDLIASAAYARQADRGAFLIAFDEGAAYESPNFLWHRERFDRFLYVDRIAVAPTHRRRGLAAKLYEDLFAFAAESGSPRVVCEVNSDPPNPASDAFHERMGFVEVGVAFLADRGKTVRYFSREL